jgi:hypothetical protein
MKRFLKNIPAYLIGFLLLLSGSLQAQEIIARLDLGKRSPHPVFYEYSPSDEGLVTFGPLSVASSRQMGLFKYDKDLKLEWSKQVLEQNGRKNIDFVTVIGPYILVFVSEFFPKEKVIKTLYYKYDLDGNVITEEGLLSVYPNEREQKVDLQYVMSPNKKRLLCYKNLKTRNESEEILYYIFDDEGDLVMNGEISLKYPDNKFNIRKVKVSNQGNVYVLGKFLKTTRIREVDDYKYVIYRQESLDQTGSEIPIDFGDKYITDVEFKLDRDENIYLAGFYSNNSSELIIGTIYQKISAAGITLINSVEKFGESFLSNYLSSGQIDRGRELKNFYLKDIILRSDGGVLLLAEKFYVTYHSYRDFYGYWVDREVYHYEDVILTSVSREGEIEWHAIVDKNQVSESQATLSYFDAVGKASTYIFYEYKPKQQGVNIYYNTVAINGQVSDRIPLLKSYKFGNEFYPAFCEQVNNQEAIMVYYQGRGKILSVVRVKFE